MWGIDLHIHTTFSPDSNVDPDRACKAAIARGLKIIGFADHAEFVERDEAHIKVIDQTKIQKEIERLRKFYADKLEILYGVEIGYIPEKEAEIKDFLSSQPFDYAIGSIHYVDGILVSRWVRETEEAGRSFLAYYEALLGAAESGLFEILGHLDYVRKYLYAPEFFPRGEYDGMVDRILEACARSGLVLELNTAGWRHSTEEPYPGEGILKRFAALGGCVTLGSDAHKYYEVGYARARAKGVLRTAGFGSVEVFRNRSRFALAL